MLICTTVCTIFVTLHKTHVVINWFDKPWTYTDKCAPIAWAILQQHQNHPLGHLIKKYLYQSNPSCPLYNRCISESTQILSNHLLFLMQIYSLIAHFYFTYLKDFFNFHFSNIFYEHSLMNVHSYEHERASCWVLLTISGWFFSQGSFPFACIFPMFLVTFIAIWSNLYFLLACFCSAAPGAGLRDKLRLAGS